MERHAFRAHGLARASWREEIRFRFDRRCPRARRQIHAGSRAADLVGERHDGAAMHDAGHGTELIAHCQLGDEALGRRLQIPHTKHAAEQTLAASP